MILNRGFGVSTEHRVEWRSIARQLGNYRNVVSVGTSCTSEELSMLPSPSLIDSFSYIKELIWARIRFFICSWNTWLWKAQNDFLSSNISELFVSALEKDPLLRPLIPIAKVQTVYEIDFIWFLSGKMMNSYETLLMFMSYRIITRTGTERFKLMGSVQGPRPRNPSFPHF